MSETGMPILKDVRAGSLATELAGIEPLELLALLEHLYSGVIIRSRAHGDRLLVTDRTLEIWRKAQHDGDSGQSMFEIDGSAIEPFQDLVDLIDHSIETGAAIRNQPHSIERGDGSRGSVMVNVAPIVSPGASNDLAIAIVFDVTERQRGASEQRFLANSGAILASSLNIKSTLQKVAELGVTALGSWCLIHLLDEHGDLQCVATEGPELPPHLSDYVFDPCYPANLDALIGPYRVLRSGDSEIVDPLSEDHIQALMANPLDVPKVCDLNLQSMLVVPLVARGRVLGTLSCFRTEQDQKYDTQVLALADDLASRSAYAIDNARLFEDARSAEHRFRTVFETVTDAMLVADVSGTIIEVNRSACSLLNHARAEIMNRSLTDFIGPELPPFSDVVESAHQPGGLSLDGSLRSLLGQLVPVELNFSIARLQAGPALQVVARDISVRLEMERLRQDFLGMVTHDLRSPLAALRLNAQLLLRRGEYNAATIEAIVTQVDRVVTLTDDLADIVRAESGNLELDRQPHDLMEIARAAVDGIRISHAPDQVVFRQTDGPVVAEVDAHRVAQIVQNLVDNALKHSYAEKPIEVTVRVIEHQAAIEVKDKGQGIATEMQERIFKRFVRSGTETASGSGLGLYFARMLTEAHGGSIEAESELAVGSTFRVRLPISAETN